jgi:transcriptional regulator with XRE-family HTH domain
MLDKYIEIGNSLKKKRIELGKELEEISEAIKVSTEYLKAIENGDFKTLPSVVYFKLFVRSYAQEMGMDGNQLLENFDGSEETTYSEDKYISDEQRPIIKRSRPESETPLLKIGLILGSIIVAVFIVIMFFSLRDDEKSDMAEPSIDHDTILSVADTPEVVIEDTIPTVRENKPVQTPDLPMKLDIAISETSWTLIIADGDTVLNSNLETGSTRRFEANYRFVISLGNPYGVEIKLNDTLFRDLSVKGRPVKGLEINRLNKSDYFFIPDISEDSLVE